MGANGVQCSKVLAGAAEESGYHLVQQLDHLSHALGDPHQQIMVKQMALGLLEGLCTSGFRAKTCSATEVVNLEPNCIRLALFGAPDETIVKCLVVARFAPLQPHPEIVSVAQEIVVGDEAFKWLAQNVDPNGAG